MNRPYKQRVHAVFLLDRTVRRATHRLSALVYFELTDFLEFLVVSLTVVAANLKRSGCAVPAAFRSHTNASRPVVVRVPTLSRPVYFSKCVLRDLRRALSGSVN
ncbi:hypothetical protein Trydic_g8137 [Trypoxylus dichotomus]